MAKKFRPAHAQAHLDVVLEEVQALSAYSDPARAIAVLRMARPWLSPEAIIERLQHSACPRELLLSLPQIMGDSMVALDQCALELLRRKETFEEAALYAFAHAYWSSKVERAITSGHFLGGWKKLRMAYQGLGPHRNEPFCPITAGDAENLAASLNTIAGLIEKLYRAMQQSGTYALKAYVVPVELNTLVCSKYSHSRGLPHRGRPLLPGEPLVSSFERNGIVANAGVMAYHLATVLIGNRR